MAKKSADNAASRLESLGRFCRQHDLALGGRREIPHGVQLAVSDGLAEVPVNLYDSGKAVVGGRPGQLRELLAKWAAGLVEGEAAEAAELPEPRVGIDESGKGDFFGPLVVAAAFVAPGQEGWLRESGVRDSKLIGDAAVRGLAATLGPLVPHELVVVMPVRYNELYASMSNLNRLLAWGHARALESLLARVEATAAISDDFGGAGRLERALMEKGRSIRLIHRVRAERDTAVACASIFARAAFLERLDGLSKRFDLPLAKGASAAVEARARRFVRLHGADRLGEVAKLHFRTTARVT